ncbi:MULTISPECIES: hypothetical protein [unclassified Bradyrhizobium]|uniref:hypothetical protein n=1 Tax=unclassified Bradyrhizobium TaxID=2631580 RepID=UPI00105052DE|nr:MULTISPECIES: hypothetical protein [unclassified Bradyrhizobium]
MMGSTWWTKPEELDKKQQTVISLPKEGNHLVTGPAGCGKTNLLLLRAAYLQKSKITNVAIFTFGRVLREFLVSGSANYPFTGDKIQTYLRWGAGLLATSGIPFNSNGEFAEVRANLLAGLKILSDHNRHQNMFDCIHPVQSKQASHRDKRSWSESHSTVVLYIFRILSLATSDVQPKGSLSDLGLGEAVRGSRSRKRTR